MSLFNLLIRLAAIFLLLLSAMTATDRQANRTKKKGPEKSKKKKL